jgi:hypothetical protein
MAVLYPVPEFAGAVALLVGAADEDADLSLVKVLLFLAPYAPLGGRDAGR